MTTNIKNMSFSELNAQIEEFNNQIEEIRNKMEELVSERQTRQEEAINNWKLHMAQVLEDTRILLEMGIDPHSISPLTDDNFFKNDFNPEENQTETPSAISESNSEVVETTTNDETVVEDEKVVKEADTSESIINDEPVSEEKTQYPLLTPFYKLWKIKPHKKEKPVKKGTGDTNINPYTDNRMVGKITTPFYKLYTDKPVRAGLKLGNMKFKKTYPDPEETRVVSAVGYSPTLTYTHCDYYVWIGPKYNEKGDLILPTCGSSEMKEAA